MIIGLKTPNSGNIFIDDKDIFQDIFETRRKIGYMSETPIYKDMTVIEYLKFLGKIRKEDELVKVIEKLIDIFSLEDIKDTLVANLSRSENKKVAIAGAYMGGSQIILLDEPFMGLDIDDTSKIIEYIQTQKNKITTIIATHSDEYLEDICDKVIIINKGKIMADIRMDELKNQKKDLKSLFIEVTKE